MIPVNKQTIGNRTANSGKTGQENGKKEGERTPLPPHFYPTIFGRMDAE